VSVRAKVPWMKDDSRGNANTQNISKKVEGNVENKGRAVSQLLTNDTVGAKEDGQGPNERPRAAQPLSPGLGCA